MTYHVQRHDDNLTKSIQVERQGGANRKIYKCDQCEEEFRSNAALKSHVKSDHKKEKLQTHHPGRSVNYECPECNKALPSASKVKKHMDKEHKRSQGFLGGNEDLDLSVTRTPPPAKRIVIFKIAGKLYWPALVVAEHDASITVRVFNKNSVVKTVPKEIIEDFNYEYHKHHISQNNSEHKQAFSEARKAVNA